MESVSGHLEILDKGFGFLRNIDNNYHAGPTDTFVPAFLIGKLGLREGTLIEGQGEPGNPGNRNLKLARVEQVNGLPLERYAQTETMPHHDQHQSRSAPCAWPRVPKTLPVRPWTSSFPWVGASVD